MNRKLAHLLTRLYPRPWRERYGAEFAVFLEECPGGLRAFANVACSAFRERMISAIGGEMHPKSSSFHVWCVRAPWAVFVFTPIVFLSVAYLVACIYLWLGWQMFLPGADTPFGHGIGPVYGVSNIYFQVGKFYYFGVPVLVGWVMVLVAVKQRAKSVWLMLGLLLIAWMGSAAQIHASRSAVQRGLGHISMDFPFGASLQSIYRSPLHALTIFLLAAAPYLIWRLLVLRSHSGLFQRP